MTPTSGAAPGGAFALADWPREVARRTGAMRLVVARLVGGKPVVHNFSTVQASDTFELFSTPGNNLIEIVTARWKAIFDPSGSGEELQALYDSLSTATRQKAVDEALVALAKALPVAADTPSLDGLLNAIYGIATEKTSRGSTRGVDGLVDAALWSEFARLFDFGASGPRSLRRPSISSLQALAANPDDAADYVRSAVKDYGARHAAMESGLQSLVSSHGFTAPQFSAWQEAVGQFALAVGGDDEGPPQNAPEPAEEPPVPAAEYPRRKLGAMLSFPTIAKYFGLCTDLLLDPGALANVEEGLIAVELKDPAATDFPATPQIEALRWAAFRHGKAVGRTGAYFGAWDGTAAAPRASQALEEDRYRDGLLNLRQTVGGVSVFYLGSGDVANAALRVKEKAQRLVGEFRTGAREIDRDATLDERASKGLVLYQRFAAQRALAERLDDAAASRAGQVSISFTKELVHGLRYDVLLDPAADRASADRWRPLTARIVDYPDLDARFLHHAAVLAVRYRDEAVAMTPESEVPIWVSGQPTTRKVVLNELMQWGGGSLAVAADAYTVDIKPAQDLGVSITFTLPEEEGEADHCPPPLRFGRRYRVRARIALPLGCGLTFDDVQADPGTGDYVLPAGDGFPVQRHEKLRAPEVLLPWDSPLVTAPDPAPGLPPHARRDSRTLDQLVIREAEDAYASDTRFLVPARVSLEDWERQGQLDFSRFDAQAIPAGAFEGGTRVALYGPDSAFPEARGGTLTWLDHEQDAYRAEAGGLSPDQIKAMKSRGSVLVMDPHAAARQQELYPDPAPDSTEGVARPRYYPDAYARVAAVKLAPVPGFSPVSARERIEFWKPNQHPGDATPALFTIRRGRNGEPVRLASGHSEIEPPSGRDVLVPSITVTLPPAEMVDLVLHAEAGDAVLEHAHFGIAARAAAMGKRNARTVQAAATMLNANLQDRRILRLVHAVQRPLERPVVTALGMKAVTVNVRAETSEAGTPLTWRQRVEQNLLVSVEGGGTTFFVGTVKAHRRSTGRLRCDVQWDDFGPDSIKLHPDTHHWFVEAREDSATLFQIESVGAPGELEDVDLTRDAEKQPRGLAYSFRDGRARRLRPRLVATSRFTNFYPAAPEGSGADDVGPFDRASGDFGAAPSIWTECTFRPPPPVVDRVLPVLLWDEKLRPERYSSERRSLLRVFLDPQWYASGEGEKLALVFDASPQAVCAYQDAAMEPFARFLTRWGRDPIRMTDPVGPLGPEHVIGGHRPARTFDLQPGAPDFGNTVTVNPHKVHIVALEPRVDPQLGLYCDIEFGGEAFDAALRSYMPFVQLGLTRYQEHAVDGLQLSRPVEYTVQLVPDRRATVTITGSRELRVDLHGQVFATPPAAQPYMHVRIMERHEETLAGNVPGELHWLPVLDARDRVVEVRVPLAKAQDSSGKDLIGSATLSVPGRFSHNPYGVLVEEYETLPADPPDPRHEDLFGGDPLAGTVSMRRGPLFLTTLNLVRSA